MASKTQNASRRKAREVALQVLYALDQGGGGMRGQVAAEDRPKPTRGEDETLHTDAAVVTKERPATPEEAFDAVSRNFEMPVGARDFARELALAVHAHAAEVDVLISGHARNWRIERMAIVDRNILRLATYELRFTETPAAVILNEAVDLARRFGADPSPAFVNGILDAIAHGVRQLDP